MGRWGLAGSVLALETVKRAIVSENLSRDLLIGPLLSGGLLTRLLEKLDWQRTGGEDEVIIFAFETNRKVKVQENFDKRDKKKHR
jgi:hypothetical protein